MCFAKPFTSSKEITKAFSLPHQQYSLHPETNLFILSLLKKEEPGQECHRTADDGEMKSHRKAYAHTEYRLGTTNTLTYNGFTVQKDRAFYWLFRNLLRWVFHSPSSRLHRNVEYNTRTSNVTPVRASTNTCGDSIFWTRFSTYIVPLNSPLTHLLQIYI